MIFHERDHTFVVGAIGIMKIRFVYENHRLRRSLCNEIAQLVLWRDARGRIIRVADVDQTAPRGGESIFGRSCAKVDVSGTFATSAPLALACSRIASKVGFQGDKRSTLFPGECFGAEF